MPSAYTASAMIRIGIDVGGTFTDLVAVDERGRVVLAKAASTPRDPSEGLLEGLGLLAAELRIDLRTLLARTERIVHGTTVARRRPGLYVSLSCDVLPQIKEYERVWTTVVNAYVGPALSRYLTNLAARLRAHGYKGEVLIMQSHGGVAPIRESARLAAGAV